MTGMLKDAEVGPGAHIDPLFHRVDSPDEGIKEVVTRHALCINGCPADYIACSPHFYYVYPAKGIQRVSLVRQINPENCLHTKRIELKTNGNGHS